MPESGPGGSVARAMAELSVRHALGAGLKAVGGEAWLPVLGMALSLSRGALALPATAFAVAASYLALRGSLAGGSDPAQALLAALAAFGSPRGRAIALGLWLAGLLLFGALRAAFLAGALATLGRDLSGERGSGPAFAAGVAYRFGRVAAAGALALLADVLGQAMALACAAAALAIVPSAQRANAPGVIAVAAAAALAGTLLLAAFLSVIGDVLLARAALAGEPAGRAAARALVAFARRPAAFLAASLGVWVATLLAVGSTQGLFGALASAAAGGPSLLLVAPQVLVAALSALVASAAELWRLTAVGALSLAGGGGGETELPTASAGGSGPGGWRTSGASRPPSRR